MTTLKITNIKFCRQKLAKIRPKMKKQKAKSIKRFTIGGKSQQIVKKGKT